MNYKKFTSAVMAFAMAASMTAVSVYAEEPETPEEPTVIETEAPAPVETQAPAPVETQAPAPIETEAPATDAPTEAQATTAQETETQATTAQETKAPATAATATETNVTTAASTETTATTASEKETIATTAESINKNIAVPKLGDFIITTGESSSSAVISWTTVEGADGYEIQLVETPANGKATSTSIPSTTKTAFQFEFGKDPMKATVRVRVLKGGEKGAWAERTTYLNGMKAETTTTAKSTTKKQETTTTKKTETGKTASPKTGDSTNIPAVAGAAAAALLAGVAVQRKKK